MILGTHALERAFAAGEIEIDPFTPAHLGANSYDLTLAKDLLVYEWREDNPPALHKPLDARNPQYRTRKIEMPADGYTLKPGILYLGSTVELTHTPKHVPVLWGKSTLGRLGLEVHRTAGFGDVGFRGHWTLELTAVHPLRVYPGMKIAQVVFFEVESAGEYVGRYQDSVGVIPARPEKPKE